MVIKPGVILTNHHVVNGATQATVRFADGQEAEAEVVEGVVEGEMEVHRYELTEEGDGGVCRFVDQGSVRATAGLNAAGTGSSPRSAIRVRAPTSRSRDSMTTTGHSSPLAACSVISCT